MHKLQRLICCVLLSVMCYAPIFSQEKQTEPRKGILRIKLEPEMAELLNQQQFKTRSGVIKTGKVELDEVHRKVKANNMVRMFPYSPKFEEKMRKYGLHLWYEIRYDENVTPAQAASLYKAIKGVKNVDMVTPMVLMDGSRGVMASGELSEIIRDDYAPFNDPLLSRQWHYNNNGKLEGWKVGADINLFKAWEITAGSPDVIVAIIDGGVDYLHEDLKDNMWSNEAELNGTEGVDDDGNDYVDDFYGWNWVRNSNLVYPHDHGTHVAGTVAAVNNNGIGVSGIAGGTGNLDGVKMMSCQIFDQMESDVDFAKALVYAANSGAVIAQCSWGWNTPDYKEQAVLDAIDYFTNEARGKRMKGGLCIFATGNLSTEGDFYPSAYEPVVAVGAMCSDYTIASYSNSGKTVNIIAPGGLTEFDKRMGVYSTTPRNQYAWMEGTSMATPHVSGIAALILSKYGNENFASQELRTQLETAVRDIYVYNPDQKGKAGVGFADAALALKANQKKAPEEIANFEIFPSQQEAGVKWVIPNDTDDHFVHHHIIYWSDKAFDAKIDLSTLNKKIIDTKFLLPGTEMLEEINTLQAETQYWFAIQAIDRWGNASILSPIINGKTNAGPIVNIDREMLDLSVDVSTNYIVSDQLQIGNSGEGLLKWSASLRKKNSEYMGTALRMAKSNTNGSIIPFSGRIASSTPETYNLVQSGYMMGDFPKSLSNYSEETKYIGEIDTTLSNSSASYFKIDATDFPDGFNLTHFLMGGTQGKGRYIIEVYSDAPTLSAATLIQSDTLVDISYNQHVALSHDLYFAPGEGLWFVVHVSSGNLNPLGIGTEKSGEQSEKCFYSSNMGKNWSLLESILKEGGMSSEASTSVWAQALISKQPALDGYLVLNPAEGKVSPNESGSLEIATTREDIIDGYYAFELFLNTNETGKEKRVIPVNVNLTGHKPELHTAKIINFGDVFVGYAKTIYVEVINSGYSNFGMASMESSDPQFKIDEKAWSGFSARSVAKLQVTYQPAAAGNHVSTITLKDNNGITHSFLVRGVAGEPGRISVDPKNFAIGDLEYQGTPKELTLKIDNTGNYPLEYVFPLFSEDTLSDVKKVSHKAGYSYISNLTDPNGFTYEWPELANATNIHQELTDAVYWSSPVELEFAFPFYGKNYDKIHIGSFGALSMTGGGAIHSVQPPTADQMQGVGIIAAFGARTLQFDKDSKLRYAHQDGKFIVSYENALMGTNFQTYIRLTFRIVLCENGDIEMYYKDITQLYDQMWEMPIIPTDNLFIGCADIEALDPFVVTDQNEVINTGSTVHTLFNQTERAIKIIAPGKNMIKTIDFPSGVVEIGGSKTISMTVAADSTMSTGPLKNILTLLSTDPSQTTTYINLEANITGGYYKPFVELKSTTFDFGTCFKTSIQKKGVTIKNSGKAPVMITGLVLKNNNITLGSLSLPYELKAGSSIDAIVTIPTDTEGTIEDELTVTSDNGQSLTALIKAKIIGTPDIITNPGNIDITLEGGSKKGTSLKINNSGTEPLKFTIGAHNYLYPTEATASAQNEEIDYIYASSSNDKKVTYEWIDITKTATEHLRIDYFAYNDYIKIGLKEKVTFYGNQFDTVYIYGCGFLTFQPYPNSGGDLPNPPLDIPSPENAFINYIAPFWGVHYPDITPIGGVYYEERAEGLVISFMDYGNSMNIGVCFQVIIGKEGRIKFQYKVLEGGTLGRLFGLAGMENENHSKGVRVPERYVSDKLAVEFYPVKTKTLAPNNSATIGLVADASTLLKGIYQDPLVISTNTPNKEEINIPVNLNVTGQAQPEYPESLNFGDVVIGNPLVKPIAFEVSNIGNAAFTISEYKLKNGSRELQLIAIPDDGGGVAPGDLMPPSEDIIVEKTPKKFSLSLIPYFLETPLLLEDVIELTTDIPGNPGINIPVSANIVESPEMDITQGNIKFYSSVNTMKFDSTFAISNRNGAYKLSYSVEIVYSNSPAVQQTASAQSGPALAQSIAPATFDRRQPSKMSAREAEEYIRELKYETVGSPLNYLGSGDEYLPFIAITSYTAPEDGFNIAAVECLANITGVSAGDIKAEIRVGNSYLTAKTIGQGTLHVMDAANENRTIQLDQPVYINPNETFFLYLTFPLGAKYPLAYANAAEKNISGRYYIYVKEEWTDLIRYEATYGPMALVVRCMEKIAGEPWISVQDASNGMVEKGSSNNLSVHVNASTARFMKGNQATIKIKGNSLDKPEHSFRVNLDKNTAPVITKITDKIEAREDSITLLTFNVKDAEGDQITVEVADADNIATHSLTEQVLTVTLKPMFNQTGNRSFTIKATDEYKNSNKLEVNYYVTKTNRSPLVVTVPENRKIHLGEILEGMDLTTVFSDPDKDSLSYVITSSDEEIAKAFEKNGVLELTPKTKGEVTINLKAYDPSGLFAETKFEIDVLGEQKANSSEKITAYPNPVIYQLNIRCSSEIKGESTLRMYDINGTLVYIEKTIIDSDVLKSIDMSSYPAGVYILEIEYEGGKANSKVIKQ